MSDENLQVWRVTPVNELTVVIQAPEECAAIFGDSGSVGAPTRHTNEHGLFQGAQQARHRAAAVAAKPEPSLVSIPPAGNLYIRSPVSMQECTGRFIHWQGVTSFCMAQYGL